MHTGNSACHTPHCPLPLWKVTHSASQPAPCFLLPQQNNRWSQEQCSPRPSPLHIQPVFREPNGSPRLRLPLELILHISAGTVDRKISVRQENISKSHPLVRKHQCFGSFLFSFFVPFKEKAFHPSFPYLLLQGKLLCEKSPEYLGALLRNNTATAILGCQPLSRSRWRDGEHRVPGGKVLGYTTVGTQAPNPVPCK